MSRLGFSRASTLAIAFSGGLALVYAGCGNDAAKDIFVVTFDAGADASSDASPDASTDDDSGIDLTLGGPCNDDTQCDDSIACTNDRCDVSIGRCRNVPDDTQCDDRKYCDGVEKCVARQGCTPGAVVTCEDGQDCTIDTCAEATDSSPATCHHIPRDVDGDGDPDAHCPDFGGHDCDDTNPNVNSHHSEVCHNLVDDNCNGQVDETPCTSPTNDTCATAQTITASGSYVLTTVASKQDYATSCATSATGAQDIVVALQVPAGGAQDIQLRARGDTSNVAVTIEATCGASASEIECVNLQQSDVRAIARGVAGGQTVYAILTTQTESGVTLDVTYAAPTTAPTNESCTAPQPIALNTPVPVSLVDAKRDLDSTCTSTIGDLTYSFTLASPEDVKIYATPTFGTADPIVSLRNVNDCSTELTCHEGAQLPLFRRNLAAGTYTIAVSAEGQIDTSILVQASAPTTGPLDEYCGTAPVLPQNQTFTIDLQGHESIITATCGGLDGGPTAAGTLSLDATSDVLLVGRFPDNELGSIALADDSCDLITTGDDLSSQPLCGAGTTPQRVSVHALKADNYRVVMTDQLAEPVTGIALVRPTVDASNVTTGDACADVVTIPSTGGFFHGDTSTMHADFDAGCDVGGQPTGGAKDQLLKLVLTQSQRVVFDMSYSNYATILDIRRADPCPGTEVACLVPSNGEYSFYDTTLDAGTYYVQVDGEAGASGLWYLSVWVLPVDSAEAGP